MICKISRLVLIAIVTLPCLVQRSAAADRAKRVLLIGQKPDSHAATTHEYMPAMHLLAQLLSRQSEVQTVIARADGEWTEGVDLIDSADGAFLFLTEGAQWLHSHPKSKAALQRLAKRSGGLGCWHWAMGTKKAEPIDGFVDLFGGCHGGPDRKHKVMVVDVEVGKPHPVIHGIKPFNIREEFYYALKFGKPKKPVRPLLKIKQGGKNYTVCWAWERKDGGRSFGFSGGHFHKTWSREEYRRLAVQGILWTIGQPIPNHGINVSVNPKYLKLAPRIKNKIPIKKSDSKKQKVKP